jgi:hypothetical protein
MLLQLLFFYYYHKFAATKRETQSSHVSRSLQNALSATAMFVVLFLYRNLNAAKSCLCLLSSAQISKIYNPQSHVCASFLCSKSYVFVSMSVVLFSHQNQKTPRRCLYFFAQNHTSQLHVCGAFLSFEISVYAVTRLLFKCLFATSMGVHSNRSHHKACMAMLARLKLNICLFPFSLLRILSGAIQIAPKLQMGDEVRHVSGRLFC